MTRLARCIRDRLVAVVAATVAIVLVTVQAAGAKYRGTDVLGNLSPESLLGDGSLVDRYPLSAYALDHHVDVGVTELSGVPPTIAHWAAAQLWSLTAFLVRTVIDVFTWAFSLDLLGATSGHGQGAIGPVSAAVSSLYENVIGEAWLATALVLAGMWGIYKALVQRRYSQTAAGLAVSVCFVLVALFFVYQPERTIGQASRWANELSLAFLSGASRGTVDEPAKAKRAVADQLFAAQVMQPWLALNFGGTRHCADTDELDADGFPRPVAAHDPTRDVCRDHMRPGRDGYGGYAPRFLRHPAGSEERQAEYEAIKSGQAPEDDPQFDGYRVDKADAPAVDVQQAGGAYQRLTLAVVIFVGSLGMICLLGFLALAVVLAQLIALVLLAFAPIALVVGVFPGGGHDAFRSWLTRLATAVFIKAVYSLVIAVVVTVAAALGQATSGLGFLMAFGLQAVFFWALFLYRKQIVSRLLSATVGRPDAGPIRTAAHRGVDLAARPFAALAALPGRGSTGSMRQESALAGSDEDSTPVASGAARPSGGSGDDGPPGSAARASGPRSPGPRHGHDGSAVSPAIDNGHAPERRAAVFPVSADGTPADRYEGATLDGDAPAANADVMRRARELRENQDRELHNGDRVRQEPRS
jgi:hypothetical protein